MMNDLEILKAINELKAEVCMLRAELRLQQKSREKADLSRRKLTMKEACAYLHKGRTTVQNKINSGEIGFAVKVGKSYLFDFDKLEEYASGM